MSDFSPLAWQFAQKASFQTTTGGGVQASIQLPIGQRVSGLGSTVDSSLHDLARELDRWNERQRDMATGNQTQTTTEGL